MRHATKVITKTILFIVTFVAFVFITSETTTDALWLLKFPCFAILWACLKIWQKIEPEVFDNPDTL